MGTSIRDINTQPKDKPNPKNIRRRPLISVVIPCLAEHTRVQDCLLQLFRQNVFKDTEIIIVEYNPNNEPYTRDLVWNMAHCRYLEVSRPGIAFARHYGITNSHSNVICNFDADCEFVNRFCLGRITKPIMEHECVLTVCDNVFDLTEVPASHLSKMEMPVKVMNLLNNAQRTTPVAILEPASCFDKQAYFAVGGFDDVKQGELFHLNNRFTYHFNNLGSLMLNTSGVHKKYIDDASVIVSSRRAVKFAEQGINVLNYDNRYR